MFGIKILVGFFNQRSKKKEQKVKFLLTEFLRFTFFLSSKLRLRYRKGTPLDNDKFCYFIRQKKQVDLVCKCLIFILFFKKVV